MVIIIYTSLYCNLNICYWTLNNFIQKCNLKKLIINSVLQNHVGLIFWLGSVLDQLTMGRCWFSAVWMNKHKLDDTGVVYTGVSQGHDC